MTLINIFNIRILLASIVLAVVVACGGGGGGGAPATATGVFKDSNVSGLTYLSGSVTGVTTQSGGFIYSVGQQVTFSIGGVVLGTVNGQSVVTPVSLVAGGTTSTPEVQNIVRFLMMLDQDGNPDNGITISPNVQAAAANWTQVNFSAVDLDTELASIISDAASVDGTPHILPSALTAQAHIESTLFCIVAGGFTGSVSGGDTGNFAVLVDAKTGFVSGVSYSNNAQSYLIVSGSSAVTLDQSAAFVSGNASSGATFSGQFTSPDNVSGNWQNPNFSISGTFAGSRVGGSPNAVYRFTGFYSGISDYGMFTVDVDGSDNITGKAYNLGLNTSYDLTGTLSGTSVSAVASDGTTITGTLDKSTGNLNGSWSGSASSGTYSGSGCKLN